jgi:hypothetical protein
MVLGLHDRRTSPASGLRGPRCGKLPAPRLAWPAGAIRATHRTISCWGACPSPRPPTLRSPFPTRLSPHPRPSPRWRPARPGRRRRLPSHRSTRLIPTKSSGCCATADNSEALFLLPHALVEGQIVTRDVAAQVELGVRYATRRPVCLGIGRAAERPGSVPLVRHVGRRGLPPVRDAAARDEQATAAARTRRRRARREGLVGPLLVVTAH